LSGVYPHSSLMNPWRNLGPWIMQMWFVFLQCVPQLYMPEPRRSNLWWSHSNEWKKDLNSLLNRIHNPILQQAREAPTMRLIRGVYHLKLPWILRMCAPCRYPFA
jgi:hypothetical protein